MAGPVLSGKLESYWYYDVLTTGTAAMAPYQCISPMTAAQIAANTGQGTCPVAPQQGTACRPSTAFVAGTSTMEERNLGISEEGVLSGSELGVRVDGIAHVMCNAAIAHQAYVFAAAAAAINSATAPLINLYELNMPADPRLSLTYNLSMIDDTAITAESSSATQLILPVGIALEAATTQYQLIRVKLLQQPFYA